MVRSPGQCHGQYRYQQHAHVLGLSQTICALESLNNSIIISVSPKLERKRPLYFRHQHYSSFQRQLNNFGFNKQHKSASPLNSVYVRVKGEPLAGVDVGELVHLRPVLKRSPPKK